MCPARRVVDRPGREAVRLAVGQYCCSTLLGYAYTYEDAAGCTSHHSPESTLSFVPRPAVPQCRTTATHQYSPDPSGMFDIEKYSSVVPYCVPWEACSFTVAPERFTGRTVKGGQTRGAGCGSVDIGQLGVEAHEGDES